MIKKQVFYDTDCLSSFLDINDWSILKSLFDEIIIPLAVYNEFFALGTPPHIIDNLNILVDEKFVKVQELNPFSDDIDNYLDICNEYELNNQIPIGEGEAQAMALVISNNGILASNNFRDIKYFVDKYKMPLLTSAYMISIAFDSNSSKSSSTTEYISKYSLEIVTLTSSSGDTPSKLGAIRRIVDPSPVNVVQ
mgnify:CR=1 FL=1